MGNLLYTCGCKTRERPESRVILVNHAVFYGEEFGSTAKRRRSSAAIRRESQQRRRSSVLRPGEDAASMPPVPPDYKYPGNEIITSRYTLWNFIPKNLFEQFQRIANFYFLLIAIVQLFIESSVSPVTSILPLVFVICVTAIKQAYEDVLRHRADNEVNQKIFDVVRPNGEFARVKAMDLRVGDVVCCRTNEGFPCDMVVLATSEDSGQCYVTTASLDGETNLKVFSALPETKDCDSPRKIADEFKAVIQCQEPVDDLYSFVGKLWVKRRGEEVRVQIRPLAAENMLLRGAVLKNTEFTLGCAVYTGLDTKMALNSKGKRLKQSQVENRLNFFLMVYFVVLLAAAVASVVVKYVWKSISPSVKDAWYLPPKNTTAWIVVQDLFGFIVLYNYLIPISLYVTIELQKFIGSKFIGNDLEMYDKVLDIPAKANTSDLNEELGQVEFLFSDKTGTLTENEMRFRQCSVKGNKYVDMEGSLCQQPAMEGEMPKLLGGEWRSGQTQDGLLEFFTVLSLCHTVRIDSGQNVNRPKDFTEAAPVESIGRPNKGFRPDMEGAADLPDGNDYEYQASSPDEKAFVEACRNYGIVFHGLEKGNCYVLTFGEPVTGTGGPKNRATGSSTRREKRSYKVLQTLDFDSERKCMTVVLRYPDNSIHVHCKGAETAMLARNCKSGETVDPDLIMRHVTDYASEGLRTLVIATKKVSEQEYENMSHQLDTARGSLNNREKALKEAYSRFESNLRLLGCTAIEDRLQDGVPDTIQQLRKAGIQVWILTGDKEETAVNISHSAGHFSPDTIEIRLTRKANEKEVMRAIRDNIDRLKQSHNGGANHGLVIDGQTLGIALKFEKLCQHLIGLCLQVNTVLCCRMTPLQKAEVVRLIKTNVKPEPVTAAIGDGANDVSMIQEAHVGLGIYGKEGRQAVRSADYAFTRFRHARRILLVHGHFFYVRIALLIQYFFYKNLVFVSSQFYYAIFSTFSAQTVYDSLYLMLYNLTFTGLPILLFGIYEQDLPQNLLYYKPEMYKYLRGNRLLTWGHFIKWNILGLWHSLVVYFGCHVLVFMDNSSVLGGGGQSDGVYLMGTLLLACGWMVVNLKLLLISHYLNWVYFIGFIPITLMLNVAALLIYSQAAVVNFFGNYDMFGIWFQLFSCATTWLIMFFTVTCSLFPDVVLRWWEDRQLENAVGMTPHRWKKQHVRTVASEVPEVQMNGGTTKVPSTMGAPAARSNPAFSIESDMPAGDQGPYAMHRYYSDPSYQPALVAKRGRDSGTGAPLTATTHTINEAPEPYYSGPPGVSLVQVRHRPSPSDSLNPRV